MKVEEMVGQKFGYLEVIEIDNTITKGRKKLVCKCKCGNKISVFPYSLKGGNTKSCGCYIKDHPNGYKHGETGTRLHRIWKAMKSRCYNKNVQKYKIYGGRGIIICDEWKNDFIKFRDWALKNGYSDNLTIDRIDVNGNYEPSNCRWVDIKTQCNNRRSNHNITYKGETKTVKEWAEIKNIKVNTLYARLNKYGWSIEKSLAMKWVLFLE